MEQEIPTQIWGIVHEWFGTAGVLFIFIFWTLKQTGVLKHISGHYLRERQIEVREKEREDRARKDIAEDQNALIDRYEAALQTLDERCRNDREECDRKLEEHASEISRLRRGLAALMDYCGRLRIALRDAGHDIPPGPVPAIEADD